MKRQLAQIAGLAMLSSAITQDNLFDIPQAKRITFRTYSKSELTPKQRKNRAKTKAQKQARKQQRK